MQAFIESIQSIKINGSFLNGVHPILSLAVKSMFRFYAKWDIFSDF